MALRIQIRFEWQRWNNHVPVGQHCLCFLQSRIRLEMNLKNVSRCNTSIKSSNK